MFQNIISDASQSGVLLFVASLIGCAIAYLLYRLALAGRKSAEQSRYIIELYNKLERTEDNAKYHRHMYNEVRKQYLEAINQMSAAREQHKAPSNPSEVGGHG